MTFDLAVEPPVEVFWLKGSELKRVGRTLLALAGKGPGPRRGGLAPRRDLALDHAVGQPRQSSREVSLQAKGNPAKARGEEPRHPSHLGRGKRVGK